MKRKKYLTCAVCGKGTKGRQWWNRDKSYGLCSGCFEWLKDRGETPEEIEFCYGKEGIHFCVN